MRHRITWFLIAAVFCIISSQARRIEVESDITKTNISVVADDARWILNSLDAKSILVPLDSRVELRILNEDSRAHYFSMNHLEIGGLLLPGESAKVQFKADAETTIRFSCSLHREVMTVELVVQPP